MVMAKEDGQLLLQTEISNLRPEKIRLPKDSIEELIEVSEMSEDQTVKSLVETLEKLPSTKIQEMTKAVTYARKLIVTDMKERKRLIHEQVNWDDSAATEDQKEQFLQKILYKYANIITVHDDEISSVKNTDMEFRIETVGPPIYQPPRPLAPGTRLSCCLDSGPSETYFCLSSVASRTSATGSHLIQ